MTATMGTNKVFILDKYFNELQKFWDTEKRLQDATSSSEATNLQTSLRSISTELVTLRSRLHTNGEIQGGSHPDGSLPPPMSHNGTMVRTKYPQSGPSSLQNVQINGSSLPPNGHIRQPSFSDAGQSTLRSVQSHLPPMTEGMSSLPPLQSVPPPTNFPIQHNYSNTSPVPMLGPSSLTSSSNVSSAFTPTSFTSQPPPVPTSQPPMEGTVRAVPSRPATPPAERQRRREKALAEEMKKSPLATINDLIHLQGPLTEDAVLKTLQARFYNQKYQTNVGPILLSMNPYMDVGNPITIKSTRDAADQSPDLLKVAQKAVRIQGDTGYPQAIILSGASGSGKSYASMVILRQLFNVAGGGPETDAFKHLAAAFTVLRSLGSAKTASSREASRIGHFIEVQVSDGALYRTKIHCYFLDQSRVVHALPTEKNYHIFYQMMAGLSPEERNQMALDGYAVRDLRYLNQGDIRVDDEQEVERFREWKTNLAVLGIPFMDVVRVLASILLLGNVEFVEGNGLEVDVIGMKELESAADLIGVTAHLLLQGLTSRTHNVRGQLVKSSSDALMSNSTRDALAKALFCRTVATIVKRANSLKRPILSGSMSSNDSVHHDVLSLHASTVGTAGSKKSSKSMSVLNNAVRHATDGFIGILDMFGFEDSKPSQLEQLCINLCSETMQHFYNTHTLKTSIESCKEEGIDCKVEVDYTDNAHCIDLVSSLRTGLLKMLDVECSVRGCPETYVQKVKVQHKDNARLFEPQHCDITSTFGIHHYAGKVVYDTTEFLDTNRDVMPDDLVAVFHKQTCTFGFATHLFGTEIKALYSEDIVPRGYTFRISPSSHSELLNGDEPVSTLTQDFHTRLDNLLRTLVHAKPHFIRCIRPNESESSTEFNRTLVRQQVRSLQVLETVNLMAGGFPHRMRFKNFSMKYQSIAKLRGGAAKSDEQALKNCKAIISVFEDYIENDPQETYTNLNKTWAFGKKYLFLSEGARQHLETIRFEIREESALLIQSCWRGYFARKKWPLQTQNVQKLAVKKQFANERRPRPQPISGTPPPEPAINSPQYRNPDYAELMPIKSDRCDFKIIQQTCSLFGLDLERPPPIPSSRPYTVKGNRKMTYPQKRIMKHSFPESSSDLQLHEGETVVVIGASPHRGHLVVERNNMTLHVPYQLMELRPPISV